MKISDTVVGVGFAGAGAAIFAATLTYPPAEAGQPGPALFPRIIAVLMGVFGVGLALYGLREAPPAARPPWRHLLTSRGFVNAAFVIGVVVLYVAAAERLGFLLTAAPLLFVLMWRLGVAVGRAALVAAGFTAFVYVLFFKLLRVPLPTGLLWW
jgi:putative tricarboxylic transport membrane protein